jgi:hypothetical protein
MKAFETCVATALIATARPDLARIHIPRAAASRLALQPVV